LLYCYGKFFSVFSPHCIIKAPIYSNLVGHHSRLPTGCPFHPPIQIPCHRLAPTPESNTLSNSNYQHIFSAALESYKKRTGKDLTASPLLPTLETCNSPDAVIALLREQIPGFDQSRGDNDSERLSNWLNPTVNVIVAFSGTIGDSVGQVGFKVLYLTYPESGR
jgi:hypothetical protein